MPASRKWKFTDQQAIEAVKKHGGVTKAAKAMGVPYATFQERHKRAMRCSGASTAPSTGTGKPSDITTVKLSDILRKHDPVQVFLQHLGSIPKGEYLPDLEMLRLCDLSKAAWSRLKRNPNTRAYNITLPDRTVVWGSAQDIALLRQKLMEV